MNAGTAVSIVVVMSLTGIQTSVQAATRYVRAGAAGSGTDWSTALSSLPSTLVRGNTYYVAAGTYGAATLDAGSGSDTVFIRKAVVADHGTDTGWNDTYADGPAVWSGITCNASYLVFDGVTGGGPGAWKDNYGFEFTRTTSECGNNGSLLYFPQMVRGVTVRHVRMYSTSTNYPLAGIKGVSGASGLTFSHLAIHTLFGIPFHMRDWSDALIEYCYIAENRSTGSSDPYCPYWHAEGIMPIGTNRDVTIRYNLWHRITGTGVIAGVNTGRNEGWKIYGNVFSLSNTTVIFYYAGNDFQVMEDMTFCNNSITGIPNNSRGGIVIPEGGRNRIYNNIWYNNTANAFDIAATHDYNYFSNNRRINGCDPPCDKNGDGAAGETHSQVTSLNPYAAWDGVLDPAEADIAPARATDPGLVMDEEFAYDMHGNRRGADGVWDRGAVEYVAGNSRIHLPAGPGQFARDRDIRTVTGRPVVSGALVPGVYLVHEAGTANWRKTFVLP